MQFSVFPEILEAIWCHFGVSNRVHDIFVAHVVLESSRVMPIVGKLIASGVPEHMGVDREWEFCGFTSSDNQFQESSSCGGTAPLGDKNVPRFRIFPA
jgi:hypothetical protein